MGKGKNKTDRQCLEAVSVSRRAFCRKAIKRSSVAAAVGVAGYLAYKKPICQEFLWGKGCLCGIHWGWQFFPEGG